MCTCLRAVLFGRRVTWLALSQCFQLYLFFASWHGISITNDYALKIVESEPLF